jgi:hypothetical protein
LATVLAVPRSPHVAKLIRFPPEVWEQFEAALRRERRSVTAQVVWLVERWLEEQERRGDSPRAAEGGPLYRPDDGEEEPGKAGR